MIVDEKKPVASPRDVAGNWPVARDVDRDLCSSSITRNVCDFDLSFIIEMCDDDANRRLDAMCSGTDAIQKREGGDDADRPMAAHSQITHAIEKDDAGYARLIDRRTQHRTHDRVGTARLVNYRAPKVVMFVAEKLKST